MCVELSEVAHYRGWPTSLGVNLGEREGTRIDYQTQQS
jgi:hypothetical protein